jgi:hypothetical protein
MADKAADPAEGMVTPGPTANTVINPETGLATELQEQTPDQFYDGTDPDADKPPPKDHATKGMVSLGYTEASRIEDTAAAQEEERKAAEKAASKE